MQENPPALVREGKDVAIMMLMNKSMISKASLIGKGNGKVIIHVRILVPVFAEPGRLFKNGFCLSSLFLALRKEIKIA